MVTAGSLFIQRYKREKNKNLCLLTYSYFLPADRILIKLTLQTTVELIY